MATSIVRQTAIAPSSISGGRGDRDCTRRGPGCRCTNGCDDGLLAGEMFTCDPADEVVCDTTGEEKVGGDTGVVSPWPMDITGEIWCLISFSLDVIS
jgi:hypothetical protein